MTFTHAISTNNYGPWKFIVDASAANGTHTTLQAAVTAASSGDTIGIRAGNTLTENITLKAGVNICAMTGDADTPNVTIIGTLACSYSGTASVSGIRLQTNSANIISLTGANATVLNVYNCFLNCTNNTGISSTGSNANSSVNIFNSSGGLGTTGIVYFAVTNGSMFFKDCILNNGGLSVTANTFSGSNLRYYNTIVGNPTTTSGTTADFNCISSVLDCNATGTTALNHNSTFASGGFVENSFISTNSATPITIGAGANLTIANVSLNHGNATAISGAGTLVYGGTLSQEATIGALTVTTLTPKGTIGSQNSTTLAAGYIGEQIRSAVLPGAPVTLTTNVAANINSVSLTRGVWDISVVLSLSGTVTGTTSLLGISVNSASFTGCVEGDSQVNSFSIPSATSNAYLTIPNFRVALSATTTYYMVALSLFTVGTLVAFGRMSAVRVG